jgi:hypothetical protein
MIGRLDGEEGHAGALGPGGDEDAVHARLELVDVRGCGRDDGSLLFVAIGNFLDGSWGG